MKDKKTFFRYLPISARERSWGAYMLDAGYTMVAPGSPYPPYKHPAGHQFTWEKGRTLHAFQFIYITRGQGLFESESGGPQEIKAGDLFVIYPEVWHRYRPSEETGWDEYWVEFDGDYARRLMQREEFTPERPILRIGFHQALLQLFLDAMDILRREPPDYQFLLGALAAQIVAHTLSALKVKQYEGRPVEDAIRQARQILASQSGKELQLEELAAQLGLSYSSFRRLFKAQTGFSPRQFALQVKLNRARDLLARAETPVYLVAEESGFESVFYFSKYFKEKTGMTPTEYRAKQRRKRGNAGR
ncbi:MAG: AraC family transcriptional regulator [Candidatus Sumerlaeota bacterium]|nr:AraC family transcriptional regulator [Candidatus Sumerlaeota bacterium]